MGRAVKSLGNGIAALGHNSNPSEGDKYLAYQIFILSRWIQVKKKKVVNGQLS
jgi:hypothetical protein